MAEIEKEAKNGQSAGNPAASGRYSNTVQYPSTRVRSYTGLNWMTISVPSNWRDFTSQDNVQFAPDGAYGDQGITRGVMIGVYSAQSNSLENASDAYLNEILQANSYLRQRGDFSRTYVAGRQGYTIQASGPSPITGRTEVVTIYTTQLRNGYMVYITTVVPGDESYSYGNAFRNILNSIRLNE